MKKIYLVKDEKVGNMQILVDVSNDVASYNFGCSLSKDNAIEFGRPEDYSLYECGFFDVDVFEPHEPIFVTNGLTALNAYMDKLKERRGGKFGYSHEMARASEQ